MPNKFELAWETVYSFLLKTFANRTKRLPSNEERQRLSRVADKVYGEAYKKHGAEIVNKHPQELITEFVSESKKPTAEISAIQTGNKELDLKSLETKIRAQNIIGKGGITDTKAAMAKQADIENALQGIPEGETFAMGGRAGFQGGGITGSIIGSLIKVANQVMKTVKANRTEVADYFQNIIERIRNAESKGVKFKSMKDVENYIAREDQVASKAYQQGMKPTEIEGLKSGLPGETFADGGIITPRIGRFFGSKGAEKGLPRLREALKNLKDRFGDKGKPLFKRVPENVKKVLGNEPIEGTLTVADVEKQRKSRMVQLLLDELKIIEDTERSAGATGISGEKMMEMGKAMVSSDPEVSKNAFFNFVQEMQKHGIGMPGKQLDDLMKAERAVDVSDIEAARGMLEMYLRKITDRVNNAEGGLNYLVGF